MTMPIIIVIGIVFFLLIALIAVFITKYRTAGPDEALIVTGSYLGNKNVHIDEGGNRLKIVQAGELLCSWYSSRQNLSVYCQANLMSLHLKSIQNKACR